MNLVESILLHAATDYLRPLGEQLRDAGWRPEVVVFAPQELPRIPGYKVALVCPLSPPDGEQDTRIDAMERAADLAVKQEEERE